jgi:hypothetical protein
MLKYMHEMFAAIAEGHPPETDCCDDRRSIAMVHAVIERARTGARVEIRGGVR